MQPADAFKSLLRDAIAPVLKEHGFSRSGQTFYLRRLENWGLINFQKSISTTASKLLFTVNIGVASTRLLRFYPSSQPDKKPHIWDCHFHERLGHILPDRADKWWTIDVETRIEPLSRELQRSISDLAVPEVEKHISDETLRDLWLSGRSPGQTEFQRLMNLVVLLQAIGPLDQVAPTLERLERITEGTPTAHVLEAYLQKLQLK